MAALNGQSIEDLLPVTGQAGESTQGQALQIAPQDLSRLLPQTAPSTAATSQQQTTQQTTEDVSKAPIFQVRATHYAYPGEESPDPNSAKGKGAWENQLSEGDTQSVALSPDMEERLGAKPNDVLQFTGTDGTSRKVVFHDRTDPSLRGRVDFYDKSGQIGDLGSGTISKVGAGGPTIPALETSNKAVQKLPLSFGMRVATNNDVQKFDSYIQSGGDIQQIPVYDRLAVAMAKDPEFLQKNFETYYDLVYKPLQQQSAGAKFNETVQALPGTIRDFFGNIYQGIINNEQGSTDAAQLAFLKATGQTTDTHYQDIQKRFAVEQATQVQGEGHAISDAWDFVTNLFNGSIQLVHPVANLFVTDPKGREQIDRDFAQANLDTATIQQGVAKLGNSMQAASATAYQMIGATDVGKAIAQATPNEAAVQGIATVANPLNYIGIGEGMAVVDAFKPILFERGLRAAEDVTMSAARKGVLDTTQILPLAPELDAANAAYVPARNLQAKLAPATRQATQDLAEKTQVLNQHLTTLEKIAGDPGTVTSATSSLLQGGATALDVGAQLSKRISDVPEMIANRFAGGNPMIKDVITKTFDKVIFGTLLHHMGPLGAIVSETVEHLPEAADAFSNLAKVAGKELNYGQATIPYWTRVAQQTKMMPKFMASFLDSPAVQTATAITKGGAAGVATGAVLGGISGGIPGAVGAAALGGFQGMAGGGFGQWSKFRDPNQYFIQARGDWKRYRDMMSPSDQAAFSQLSPTNQIILAQHAQHFPGLNTTYTNDPKAPKGMHFTDQFGRSNIEVNLAFPDSVIRGTLSHELIHGTVNGGILPDIYDTLLGNPKRGTTGQYTALDGEGKPIGVDPTTSRYITDQNFANLKNQYTGALAQSGKPTAHLTDLDIAREVYAEHGVDYLLSGGAILDSNSAFRPGLLSKNALKTAMAKMGYTFDQAGHMVGAPNGQIGGTGLFNDLQKNPDLGQLAKSYFQTGWREGKIDSEDVPTTRFRARDMQNPNVAESTLTNAAEIRRKPDGTAMRDPNTGLPIYRTPKEVAEYNANFAQAMRKGIDGLSEGERMDMGYRQSGENIFARYLPDKVIEGLAKTNQYNPHQIASLRMLSNVLGDAGSPGMEARFFYHKALAQNKKYGQFEGTEKIAVPYGLEITKDQNVNIKSVDFNQLNANYTRVKDRAPYKNLWPSEDAFVQDAHTYFTNHSKNQPGADGIGTDKRDAINALAGLDVQQQRDANPLVDRLPKSVAPIIKSYRLDRANQITATGTLRPFVSEAQYYKMAANYLPGGTLPEYLPAAAKGEAAPAEQLGPEAIPVTTRTTSSGKTVPQTYGYDIANAPLVANKQPGLLTKDSPNKFGHVDFLGPLDQKRLTALDQASATTTYSNKLVKEFNKWKGNPDVMAAKTWYGDVRGYLDTAFGDDSELFGHLLAATSPQQGVVQNWHDALEAYRQYKSGAYDASIEKFNQTGKITEDMKPTKANGTKFGVNSDAVLKVLAGKWLDTVEGPKTPNFFDNLFGRGTDATIDKWAGRTMRRMGNEGVKGAPEQWRLTPPSEKGVSDLDFAFSQEAFGKAAKKVGMDPHELQAVMWYAEKHHWAEQGYSKGGAAAAKASYVPMLKQYAESVTAAGGP